MPNRSHIEKTKEGFLRRVPIVEKDLEPELKPETDEAPEESAEEIPEPVFPPRIIPCFSPVRKPYSEICAEYGITVSAKILHQAAGFDRANYNSARTDRRPVTPGQMIAACLLSKLSVQNSFDAFHYCKDTKELTEYDLSAQVLVKFLSDEEDHSYDELIRETILTYADAGITTLPKIYRRNRRWIEVKARMQEESCDPLAPQTSRED